MKFTAIAIILIFLLQITLVSSLTDKIIKLSFTIDREDNVKIGQFEPIEETIANQAKTPKLYSLKIKSAEGEVISEDFFAPAFFVLYKGNITATDEATITKKFAYEGKKWESIEIYKEDKLIFEENIEKKFCKETRLCGKFIKTLLYVASTAIGLLLILYIFIRKRRQF